MVHIFIYINYMDFLFSELFDDIFLIFCFNLFNQIQILHKVLFLWRYTKFRMIYTKHLEKLLQLFFQLRSRNCFYYMIKLFRIFSLACSKSNNIINFNQFLNLLINQILFNLLFKIFSYYPLSSEYQN